MGIRQATLQIPFEPFSNQPTSKYNFELWYKPEINRLSQVIIRNDVNDACEMSLNIRIDKHKSEVTADCQTLMNNISSKETFVSFLQQQKQQQLESMLKEIDNQKVCDPKIKNRCRKIDATEADKEKLRNKKIENFKKQEESYLTKAEEFRQAAVTLFPFDKQSCFSAPK